MITRLSESQLLCPADVTPLQSDSEVIGVFNPGAVRIGNDTVLLVRVAERPLEKRTGFVGLPRWNSDLNCAIDWIPEEDIRTHDDPRVVQLKRDGSLRLTSVSHLRVFRKSADSPKWLPGPVTLPQAPIEEFGIEDPRITMIDRTYWITYVAISRQGVGTALASSTDMITFKRHGLIFCPENKDVVLFPQQFEGHYAALHRPNPNSHFSSPSIWLARSPDLIHWGVHQCLCGSQNDWEADRIGGGTPPVLISEGWLHLYHGNERDRREGVVGQYSAGALLLDRDDPSIVIARSDQPIMEPLTEFEQNGFVPNVVFPTGLIIQDNQRLGVYYGAADTSIGVVEFSKHDILEALR